MKTVTEIANQHQPTIRDYIVDIDHAWYLACRQIIDRYVAPNMYANAMEMLEVAHMHENHRTSYE